MYRSLLSRLAGWWLFPGALVASLLPAGAQTRSAAASPADDPAVRLGTYVISASRSLQDRRSVPSAVSVVPRAELAASQTPALRTALAQEPGVAVVTTGTPGAQTSVFLRGANSHQTLFVVDGVRMNDRAASYTNFLGAADLVGVDRFEILRGPQSTLYGSSAMGGVILLEMPRGSGAPGGSVSAVAGSFDTWGGSAAVSGESGAFDYSGAAARFVTANDVPHNDFEQWSYATRLGFDATERLSVGATFRGLNAEYEENGSRQFPSPGDVRSDNYLGTVFAQARWSDTFRSRLTFAQHERRYRFTAPWGVSEQRNRRRILDWLNTWTPSDTWELVGGANYERSRYLVSGAPTEDEVAAAHVSTTVRPVDAVTLTGGVRHDDFDSFGRATTWRTGASWQVRPATKLRATFGTGFSAPGSDDRYGVPSWGQRPNPDLAAEKSRGWDVGLDHELGGGRLTLAATYFQNRFRNLFEWETVDFTTFEGRTVNRSRAATEGVELALVARPVEALRVRLAYTYLDARDTAADTRLIRRPRHTLDGEVRAQPTAAWIVGVGAHFVGDRIDTGGPLEDYTTMRVFTSYAVRPDLTLKLRLENALDEAYEEVLGYPALPRGVFGGVEWSF